MLALILIKKLLIIDKNWNLILNQYSAQKHFVVIDFLMFLKFDAVGILWIHRIVNTQTSKNFDT